ncbi:uncharacterized protein LOC119402663 [Rhipicephalus sanguineus]|uniref:uncharacterized protein LOC119402663 n=1 Tax=Rhipicephalus sanguineus TaxID=34632 RepID=UPI0018956584|nr:uncharacterized protein LOC119402663 [Rhipicephalus sanguineus]
MMSFAACAVLLAFAVDVAHGAVQYHQLIKCSQNYSAEIMGVVTRDAVVGQQMTAKIKLRVYDTILKELKMRVALFTPQGTVVPCIERFGSCVYDVCEDVPESKMTMWTTKCPVKPGTYWRNLVFRVSPKLLKYIGNGNLIAALMLESKGKKLSCQALHLRVFKTRPTTDIWD